MPALGRDTASTRAGQTAGLEHLAARLTGLGLQADLRTPDDSPPYLEVRNLRAGILAERVYVLAGGYWWAERLTDCDQVGLAASILAGIPALWLGGYPVTPGQAGEPATLGLLCRDVLEGSTAVSVTFPGKAAFVPSARRFVRGVLAGCPRAGDLEIIASEMMSNAIRHTPAGQPGGTFTLTVRTRAGRARVEVSSPGSGEWEHDRDTGCPDDEDGRGLAIINVLADTFGHYGNAAGQTVWAQAEWTED